MRRHRLPFPLLLVAPLGTLGFAAALSWGPGAGGQVLVGVVAALAGASGVAAFIFALDAMRMRRAFSPLAATRRASVTTHQCPCRPV